MSCKGIAQERNKNEINQVKNETNQALTSQIKINQAKIRLLTGSSSKNTHVNNNNHYQNSKKYSNFCAKNVICARFTHKLPKIYPRKSTITPNFLMIFPRFTQKLPKLNICVLIHTSFYFVNLNSTP